MVNITKGVDSIKTLKMLIYGPSGVGKTVFGSTAPKCLFIDAEAGMLSVSNNIDRIKISTYADLKSTFDFLKSGQHEYKTIIVDSITELQKKCMDEIVEKGKYDRPTISDWGLNIESIRKMIRAFRDLDVNVIFIALEQSEKEEATGLIIKHPGLQGKTLPAEIMGFVDIVGYMVAEERVNKDKPEEKSIVRAIRVQPSATVSAKDRSGKLGTWVKPDFAEIYNTVFSDTPVVEQAKVIEPEKPAEEAKAPAEEATKFVEQRKTHKKGVK